MPAGLKRWQQDGDDHFLTFSCYQRKPFLGSSAAKHVFLHQLEQLRERHDFSVFEYVLMPEHVHLLVSEPKGIFLADVVRALKGETSRVLKGEHKHFWQKRYFDFNVLSWDKRVEKLKYMHRNPVKRELVATPAEYPWSSFNRYASGIESIVQLDTEWIQGWQRR